MKIELQKWIDNPFEKEQPPPNLDIQGISFLKNNKTKEKTNKLVKVPLLNIYLGQDCFVIMDNYKK